MQHLNVEIKARCANADAIRAILKSRHADAKGTDHQIDTYFNVPKGRLKLREGNIENALIFYERPDQAGPKQSNIVLHETTPDSDLKAVLTAALGVKVVVDKQREISFIDNVKFHLDTVAGLGSFVEIEAIDADGSIGRARLLAQCQEYLALFGIKDADLVEGSYSDLLLEESDEHTRY